MPGDLDRAERALRAADKAGDTAAARRLAQYIRQRRESEKEQLTPAQAALYSASEVVPFSKQIAAGAGAVAGEAAELVGLDPGKDLGGAEATLGQRYAGIRDLIDERQQLAEEQQPAASAAGTTAGIAAQIPRQALLRAPGAIVSGGRALLTRAGLRAAPGAAVRAVASREGLKAAAGGAAYGVAAEASEGEGDYVSAATTGAAFGVGARGLFGAGAGAVEARGAQAAERATLARAVGEFDEAVARLPEERAAVQAENKAAQEAASQENAVLRERFRVEKQAATREARTTNRRQRLLVRGEKEAAKADAEAATRARQEAADAAAREETLKNPLIRTGLEGKMKTLGGGPRAKARAQALTQETLPDNPSVRLVDAADALPPDERLSFATGLRRQAGQGLGAIRDELAQAAGVSVPVAPIRQQIRGAFSELPPEVQKNALKQVDGLIGAVAKKGQITPGALRKLIQDTETLAKYGTPNLEAALGDARGRVFQAARGVLVQNERDLIASVLPDRADAYAELLRKYQVYSDFELGSKVFFERAAKGRPTIRIPKGEKVEPSPRRPVAEPEPVLPREVPKPELRQPLLKAEPSAPDFPGGDERLAQGRKLLQPSGSAKAVATAIRTGLPATGALVGSSMGGGIGAVAGSTMGSTAAPRIADRWLSLMSPTIESLSKQAKKLERLQPLWEEALRKGPQAVAILHAQLMRESEDYREYFRGE